MIVETQLEAPKLLVEWSSPWQEFRTSIRPALARSPRPLAGEARTGLFPVRNIVLTWTVELLLLLLAILLPGKLARMHIEEQSSRSKYDIIYYSADELPRMEDNGGSSAGRSGKAGGQHGFHRTQAIRVARGETPRGKIVDAPKLNLPHSDSAVANLLAYKALPGPAPTEGLKSSRQTLALPVTPVAPAPGLQNAPRDRLLTAPSLSANVVPPAPNAAQRDLAPLRLPGSQPVEVVPPPVSAPEKISNLSPKLVLPAPAVVAPPPTQISRDLAKVGPGYGPNDLRKQIIPPPVQMSGGATDHRNLSGLGSTPIVPPPVNVSAPVATARKLGEWNGSSPVAPPVQISNGSLQRPGMGGLGASAPVAPPVQVSGSSLQRPNLSGLGSATSVVPPPPSVSSASSLAPGNRGAGLGGALDANSVSAPAASGGSVTGVVVSSQPGPTVAVPGNAGKGSLAMSPTGGPKPGVGGAGGGTGIDFGAKSGSGASGDATGAAKSGAGRGAELSAKAGISPYPGSGGAGSGTAVTPVVPGISVHGGGNNIVTLPSFGTSSSPPTAPPGPSTAIKDHRGSGVTIVATSRSGGAFNFYGALKGDKVYTIYLPTSLGTAVMQFADANSAAHPYNETLVSPQPLRTTLPANLHASRLVISCTLDPAGSLKNFKVLEPGNEDMTAKVLAALPNWKFSPALHGERPVEVNAILGFDIDTR